MNNEQEFIEEETEEIPFQDKRRINEEGERIDIEVGDGSAEAEVVENPKSPEVVKLENALKELSIRCEAAKRNCRECRLDSKKKRRS